MITSYHNEVIFEGSAFGKLKSEKAESEHKITFKVINIHQSEWVAHYKYGPNKRPVVNKVSASFEFQDGKIIRHTDHFSLWKWS